MSRVARSRAVHAALEAEFTGGMHALSLVLRTPEEREGGAAHLEPPLVPWTLGQVWEPPVPRRPAG